MVAAAVEAAAWAGGACNTPRVEERKNASEARRVVNDLRNF